MSTLQAYTERAADARTRSLGARLSTWAVPLGVAAVWVLLIWSIHRESPRTLVSFHGLLHAAIVEELSGPGGSASLPPENPFFAGQPVAYYWFFHMVSAQLVRLFGMNVFHAMEALILFATGVLMFVAVAFGRKLYESTLAGVLIGYLIMAGTNPLGILFAIYKVARNGLHVLEDDPEHLWGVVHPLYSMIRYNDMGGLYGPLLNFFLNITSRPIALAALLLAAFCFYRALRSNRVISWVLFGLVFALTTAFSPIIGLTSGGALGVGLVAAWLWERRQASAAAPQIRLVTIAAAGLAISGGILLAAPTYYHLILGPSSSQARFYLFTAVGLKNLVTETLSILPLAAMALYGTLRARREHRQFLVILFLSAVALFALSVAISLPASNNSNMFHAAAVLLAVPAAGAILCRKTGEDSYACSGRRAVSIGAIFLPTLLALLATYVLRPPLPASFESVHLERLPRDSDLSLLYGWVRNETGPEVVFIIDPRNRVAMCGNTAEFPAMTGRSIFTEHFRHYMAEPYAESKTRFDMAVRLVSGAAPGEGDRAYLAGLKRPVFMVSDLEEGDALIDQMKALYGPAVFQRGRVSVYRLSKE